MTEKKEIPEATKQQLHEQVRCFREVPYSMEKIINQGSVLKDLIDMLEPYADSEFNKELDNAPISDIQHTGPRFVAAINLMHRLGVW